MQVMCVPQPVVRVRPTPASCVTQAVALCCVSLCQMYAGGSVEGAAGLCRGDIDIAFNWSGAHA